MTHTILGAGGSIASALTIELLKSNEKVRLVSRSSHSVNGTESVIADISFFDQTLKSVKDSDFVYLCVGLSYDTEVWSVLWSRIMQNVIEACKITNAKLIFFDNVYMYGKASGKMTETSPYDPCSRKGEIRANLAIMLQDEMRSNNLQAIIARSADLYGPYIKQNSVAYLMIFDKLMKGKSAQWLVNANTSHTFTYTLDCAKGLNLLRQNEANFQQIWHLPTSNPGITAKKFIQIAAKELNVKPDFSVLPKWMIKMAGYFNKTIYESYEMLYQLEDDYYFDSTKFNEFFNYQPISMKTELKRQLNS